MMRWFSWARQRKLQYNLRTLLLAVLVCAVGLWAWDRLRPGYEQRQFLRAAKSLGGVGNIEGSKIRVSFQGINDVELAYLASLPGRRSVVQLGFAHTGITDDGMDHLAKFPELNDITFRGCQITDEGFEKLRLVPKLRSVHVTECASVTDAGVGWLAERRGLRMLNVLYTSVSAAKLRELQEALPYCDVCENLP